MRRISALCATAAVALIALAATSPAQASYHLIKWQGTGYCQVWDNNVPGAPMPANYRVVSHKVAGFDAAVAMKTRKMHAGSCKS